ncbi:MAG: glycosyltransferase family 39 protein [Acidobacteriota bacterium]|jgi:4-amino-4-deoxy-L-arabinose transferase-like glycosyltransferase|nr:glycosyltransferase family 39 protein [Acidobacteriota bacterium]
MSKNRDKIIWIVFAIIIVTVYLFALNLPLLGPDEPRYAQVGREMFERGDWITPTLGGFNWFEKPALLYWLQIVFYNIFGVNEFAARFGSALFGLGTVLSLWILGRNVQSSEFRVQSSEFENQSPKSNFANWLGLIAASSLGLIVFSRGASFDIMITFPITASLVCYFLFDTFLQKHYYNEDENFVAIKLFTKNLILPGISPKIVAYFWLIGFYVFIGIALLAKGLIGIVFPFAIVFFYHILKLELLPSKTFLISLFWGTILSILVASIWYLPVYLTNGWEFIDEFFIQHHFQRFASNKFKHPQPFWFFWVIFPLFTIPWIPFFFASIWDIFRKTFSHKAAKLQSKSESQVTNSELRLFAFAWMLVPLVFFSLSGSKLPGYILPALPAACILTAEYVYRFVQKNDARKYLLQGLAFLMFIVVAILLQFVVPNFAEQDSTKHLVNTANANGFSNEKILNLHTVSHNIEFYGNERLVREKNGEQKKFNGVAEIVEYLKGENKNSALVLVPQRVISELTESPLLDAKILDKNAEIHIVAVKLK